MYRDYILLHRIVHQQTLQLLLIYLLLSLFQIIALLENGPWAPAEKRPKAPVSQPVPRNRDHWPLLKTPDFSTGALGLHWYRFEIPAGTKEAATLT